MSHDSTLRAPVHHELLIAGFGGQGVLTLGQILAAAAMQQGYEVVWTPAYGPEMRGGTAFCTVIISSKPIGSPAVAQADTVIIMDRISLEKFQQRVRPGGMILVNSSLVDTEKIRPDIRSYAIRVNHLAEEIGDSNIANMVMLGAFIELSKLVSPASIIETLRETLPEHRRHLIPLNEQALAAGANEVTAACHGHS